MIASPEVSGLLYKRRGGFGKMMPNAWQYRFFAITREGFLLYFDTENADAEFDISRARGRLDLKSITYDYSIDPIEGAPTNYAIQIGVPGEEKWKLCADTKDIQAKWCKVLDKFMVEKNFSKTPAVFSSVHGEERDVDRPKSLGSVVVAEPVAAQAAKDENSTSKDAAPFASKDSADAKTPKEVFAGAEPKVVKAEPVPTASSAAAATPAASFTAASSTSTAAGAPHKAAHSKKRLKLAAKKDFIDQETIEWGLVILVLNLCILGAIVTPKLWVTLFYVLVCNFVVGFTLKLRYERAQKKAAPASIPWSETRPASTMVTTASAVEQTNVAEPAQATTSVIVEESQTVTETVLAPSGKPLPGSTLPISTVEPKLSPPHTWCKADHRQFSVRVGPDYNRYKKKAPSGSPIYEAFAVDVFCAKQRVDHAASRFELPDTSDINTNNPHVPPIFVVQIQIPSEPPTSFFSSSEDGPGWAVVMYFKITEDACRQLQDLSTASPAVKLFAEWCEKAPTDPAWRGRFKVINSCTNMEELGFPSMIVSYNAKPVLIRRTGTIFRGPNYMEMDIHVHKFANVAKQSIYLISSRCGLMFMQIGFVIEGREDKELPEALFGCVAVNRPQEDQAEFIFDE